VRDAEARFPANPRRPRLARSSTADLATEPTSEPWSGGTGACTATRDNADYPRRPEGARYVFTFTD
jgi:hypothetical protein